MEMKVFYGDFLPKKLNLSETLINNQHFVCPKYNFYVLFLFNFSIIISSYAYIAF